MIHVTAGLLLVLEYGLAVFCFVDVARSAEPAVPWLPRWGWIIALLVFPLAGSVAWLVAGHARRLELRAGGVRAPGTVSEADVAEQVAEAQAIAPIVCVQNHYNVAHRDDDPLIDSLAEQQIAYVPYFPLGGFSPLQADALSAVAARLGASDQQVALAWLLQRSPALCVIPGTSSPEHLRENVAAATLELPADALDELEGIDG